MTKQKAAEAVAKAILEDAQLQKFARQCGTCNQFVPCDMGGAANAKPAHCTLHSAVGWIEVEDDWWCRHWHPKPELVGEHAGT